MSTVQYLRCDHQACGVLQSHAESQGWKRSAGEGDLDLCPQHAPKPKRVQLDVINDIYKVRNEFAIQTERLTRLIEELDS